jgi:hypothetical protein
MQIAPSITMTLVDKIEKKIWNKYSSYKNVLRYIRRWHQESPNNYDENFSVRFQDNGNNIDLPATLDGMDDELLFQIAVDLNIEVPGLIYSVAEIKGMLADKYENAASTFDKACQKIYSEPSTAILMANSALERIIKKICADGTVDKCKSSDTLYALTAHILKQFNFFPDKSLNANIRNIGSGLLNASQAIENLRSNHTDAHGTESEVISDPLYAMLVVNSVSTIGLFLLGYYDKHYKQQIFDDDVIPF